MSKTSPQGQRILLLTVDVHVTFDDVVKLPLMKQDLHSLSLLWISRFLLAFISWNSSVYIIGFF